MNTREIYAHTLDGRPSCDWEPLYGGGSHAERVEECLHTFSPSFSPEVAEAIAPYLSVMGLVHDMGKASADFQEYLKGRGASVDHKTAGAKWAMEHCGHMGKIMAYALYGHHSGLPKGVSLFENLRDYEYRAGVTEALPMCKVPEKTPPLGSGCVTKEELAFQLMLGARMLHSTLIDADWLATESFMEPNTAERRARVVRDSVRVLSESLEAYLQAKERNSTGKISALRREIHEACYRAAREAPGVFRLNVPTGGGKTLSSLSFALEHACRHGLNRVIYVIPYTSIIDQTARVFREVLGEENVVEHHSNITASNDSEDNRMATENWDAPVIVTTTVQFFESLYSAGNQQCRKVHNIGRSVIIFDEAQCLPCDLLSPCIHTMKALQRLCGCSLVLCTATQPAFEFRQEYFQIGWKEQALTSLIGEELERKLAQEMKRVKVEELGSMTKPELVGHFAATGCSSALFIVNLTRQARELFELFSQSGREGVYHLSARMCAAHRVEVLNRVSDRLEHGKPTILVATRVVEAGVDISFPVVYRDACGLDSLAQAAGRCNRNGELPIGLVYSFRDEECVPSNMADLRDGIYAAEDVRATMPDSDFFHPDRIQRYFQLFYSKRKMGTKCWDKAGIGEKTGSGASMLEAWDFPEIDAEFKMIPQGQRSVIVCYGAEAENLRNRLLGMDHAGVKLSRRDYRILQQYAVNIYTKEWEALHPFMEKVHSDSDIWMLVGSEYYHPETGLLKEVGPMSYIY